MKGILYNFINFAQLYKNSFPLFKNSAFLLDPEVAHELTILSMKYGGQFLSNHLEDERFFVHAFGLTFKNPMGLAAGLDKNAEAINFLTHLPFGFIEVGTVTPLPQVGNDKPRLWRYIEEESLRNRMGFNNLGGEQVLSNLKKAKRRGKVVGVNIGKNKNTPNEEAARDYLTLYRTFCHDADYIVVNVSSPNTPGLRDLLKDSGLRDIFEGLSRERKIKSVPLLVKVSPDMEPLELTSVVGLVNEYKLDGIIATNTTIMKDRGEGGVSGKLLLEKSKKVRAFLLEEIKNSHSRAELIGVGGFSHFNDYMDFWKAGGKLLQIYSAFVFQGPPMLYAFEAQLALEYKKRGVRNFSEFQDSLLK